MIDGRQVDIQHDLRVKVYHSSISDKFQGLKSRQVTLVQFKISPSPFYHGLVLA